LIEFLPLPHRFVEPGKQGEATGLSRYDDGVACGLVAGGHGREPRPSEMHTMEWSPMIVELSDITEPEVLEFLDYWSAAKGDAFAPTWKQFNLSKMNPKLVPYVIVADAIYAASGEELLDFVIRFWGTGQTEWKGADKTGKRTRDFPQYRGPAGWEEYLRVVDEKRPIASRDTVYREQFGKRVNIEQVQVRVPLSDDGVKVTKVATFGHWAKV
jgi:hypothetical protein